MKKIFLFLTSFYLSCQNVFGDGPVSLKNFYGDSPKYLVVVEPDKTGEQMVLGLISQVIDLMLYFAGIIAVGFIIYGGIRLITDFGNDNGISEAKNIVLHSIIGLLVIFISIILIDNTGKFVRFIVSGEAL